MQREAASPAALGNGSGLSASHAALHAALQQCHASTAKQSVQPGVCSSPGGPGTLVTAASRAGSLHAALQCRVKGGVSVLRASMASRQVPAPRPILDCMPLAWRPCRCLQCLLRGLGFLPSTTRVPHAEQGSPVLQGLTRGSAAMPWTALAGLAPHRRASRTTAGPSTASGVAPTAVPSARSRPPLAAPSATRFVLQESSLQPPCPPCQMRQHHGADSLRPGMHGHRTDRRTCLWQAPVRGSCQAAVQLASDAVLHRCCRIRGGALTETDHKAALAIMQDAKQGLPLSQPLLLHTEMACALAPLLAAARRSPGAWTSAGSRGRCCCCCCSSWACSTGALPSLCPDQWAVASSRAAAQAADWAPQAVPQRVRQAAPGCSKIGAATAQWAWAGPGRSSTNSASAWRSLQHPLRHSLWTPVSHVRGCCPLQGNASTAGDALDAVDTACGAGT